MMSPDPDTPGLDGLATAWVNGGGLGQDDQQRISSFISHVSFLAKSQGLSYLLTFQIYDPKYFKGLDHFPLWMDSSSFGFFKPLPLPGW